MKSDKDATSGDSLNQVATVLQSNLPGLDILRAVTFDNLQFLRTARATGLQSEQERLANRLGDDDPRVINLAARRAENELFISGLAAESERARVVPPDVNKDAWVLHGFIRDQQLRGVPKVTVALYDSSGNWIQQLGFAGTSANGYFRLDVHNLANLKPPLFVHVLSGQATLLHADDEPLTPELATVLFHEVIVTGEKTAAPPVESRNDPVAQPDTWIVRGRVTDKGGKGLSKLIVSVYDKDLLFDDKLGQTETDSNGDYTLTYHTEDFRDLIERKPDIYVKVLDQKGNTLYSSKKKIKFNVGRVEIVNVKIGE
ncbi:MAG TPA: hypothetical protein VN476_09540 [Pyrinomonadaceae bacterium]|nr:hypothetical protein [Pyrinomonadaceae bacterium]